MVFFWFRRDLRLEDNVGLFHALSQDEQVLPVFIFDTDILNELPKNDARVTFIHAELEKIDQKFKEYGSSLLVKKGNPLEVWKSLFDEYALAKGIYANHDYEPYAIKRDQEVKDYLEKKNFTFKTFKDQVIFEKEEVLKDDGDPYVVYTPYKRQWLKTFSKDLLKDHNIDDLTDGFWKLTTDFPTLNDIGFEKSPIEVKPYNLDVVGDYDKYRNFPAKDKTSYLSPHLRFGTVSIRKMVAYALDKNETFLSELIWREFFMQILYHFPRVVNNNFREKYDGIKWRNNKEDFEKWKSGNTGYPIVDAGMRELNETGYMHNRVRMVVASFLCKHLLIDWKWGEAYFAEKLFDYELASNNGNWQWAAGTGCDAAPYFRVFNPTSQLEKFDPELKYTRKWVKDFDELTYPKPMVEHKFARERALAGYKEGIKD